MAQQTTVVLPDLFALFCKKHILPIIPRQCNFVLLDGMGGLGKTHVANALYTSGIDRLGGLISLDSFLLKDRKYYFRALCFDQIKAEIENRSFGHGPLILEGCQSFKVAEHLGLDICFRIYFCSYTGDPGSAFERLSEPDLFDDSISAETMFKENPSRSGLTKEMIIYHKEFKPMSKADLIIRRFDT